MRPHFGRLVMTLSLLLGQFPLAAQNVQVNSANPNQAAQGTISLDVAVGGSGFKQGAKSQWVVSGTTNPGGVTVNSTTFVSSSQVTANITVSTTAVVGNFDILVTNLDGRSGKGTGLFAVKTGGQTCTLAPLPAQFTLVTTLNDNTPAYSGGLGSQVRVRHIILGGQDVLVAAVGSSTSGKLEVFFLDPATGAVLDGTPIGSNTQPQPHITKPITLASGSTFGTRIMAMGDVNADNIPDIAVGSRFNAAAFAFVGSVDASGILSYSDQISFPPGPGQSQRFGAGLAMGDLDGIPGDEVAVADTGFGTGHQALPGGVFIYKFAAGSFNLLQTIKQPAFSVSIGDVTGDSNNDLILSGTYVYPGPSLSSPITLSGTGLVAAAHVFGGTYADVISLNNVYRGPVSAGEQPAFTVSPSSGQTTDFGFDLDTGDINGDGLPDILIGAPNTEPSSGCSLNTGTAWVFLSNPAAPGQPTEFALEPPTPGGLYAWSIGAAAGTRIFLVGEISRNINGVTNAGQVWVYKVN